MKRIALLVAIGVLATAASVSAQASNTSAVTGGIFTQDSDNIVHPYNFAKVKKGTWSGWFGYDQNGSTSLQALNGNLFGDFLYWGNYLGSSGVTNTGLVGSSNNESQTSKTTNTFDATTYAYTGKSVETVDKKYWKESSDNTFYTLVGFGGFGSLRAAVTATPKKFSGDFSDAAWDSNNSVPASYVSGGSTATKKYDAAGTLYAENGTTYDLGTYDVSVYSGSAYYGNSVALGGITIKGYVGAGYSTNSSSGVGSYTDYNKSYNTALPDNTSYSKTYRNRVNSSYSKLTPEGNLAVDVALDKFTFTIGSGYSLALPTYANAYEDGAGNSQTGGSVTDTRTVTKTVTSTSGVLSQTVNTTRAWLNDDISMSTNTISPKLQFKGPLSDAFNFGIAYVPVVTLATETHKKSKGSTTTYVNTANLAQAVPGSDYTYVSTMTASGYQQTINTFSWSNPVTVAGQFVAIPSLLSFNAGVTVNLPAVSTSTTTEKNDGTSTTTNVQTYGNGKVSKSASTNTVQGSDFGTGTPPTDTQYNKNEVATGTPVTLKIGAVYNLTADTFADVAFTTTTNKLDISQLTVQLTSRY